MFAGAESWEWILVFVLFIALLALDIGVINRKGKHITTKAALKQTAGWILVAFLFGVYIWHTRGAQTGMEYYASYVIEEALSVDNMFVFLLIFSLFAIPDDYQHKALFYGVVGAIAFRFIFIFAGAELLDRFDFLMYIFGALLIFAALRTVFGKDDGGSGSKMANWLSRHMSCCPELDEDKFFTYRDGVRMATPLFICVIVLELSDIMFALDSIPAILSITTDKFILFTSNIFAVLGLRSLYFAVRGALTHLRYLKYGLGGILTFVGAKMMLHGVYEFDILLSLLFVVGALAITIIASLAVERKSPDKSV
jgi:tellurite resistance protein TerC